METAELSFDGLSPGTVSNSNGVAAATDSSSAFRSLAVRPQPSESQWYAAYTSANHEKRVAQQLRHRDVQHFLPLYSSTRRWKDRNVVLQLPLFAGYVFVRISLRDRLCVLQVPGVANLVSFEGQPAPLPEQEMEALRTSFAGGGRLQPHPYLAVGRRVRVKSGPLSGIEGFLMRKKNASRLVISLDLIGRSVAVEMNVLDVEPSNGK